MRVSIRKSQAAPRLHCVILPEEGISFAAPPDAGSPRNRRDPGTRAATFMGLSSQVEGMEAFAAGESWRRCSTWSQMVGNRAVRGLEHRRLRAFRQGVTRTAETSLHVSQNGGPQICGPVSAVLFRHRRLRPARCRTPTDTNLGRAIPLKFLPRAVLVVLGLECLNFSFRCYTAPPCKAAPGRPSPSGSVGGSHVTSGVACGLLGPAQIADCSSNS